MDGAQLQNLNYAIVVQHPASIWLRLIDNSSNEGAHLQTGLQFCQCAMLILRFSNWAVRYSPTDSRFLGLIPIPILESPSPDVLTDVLSKCKILKSMRRFILKNI